jgi:transmembrane sensor
MKESDQIPEYVFACLAKHATKQELELLEKWLNEPGNALLYRQLRQIDQLSSDLKLYRTIDVNTARGKVLKSILSVRKLSWFSWMQRVAAILFLPLVLTSLFVLYQYKILKTDLQVTSVIQQIDTQPGTKTHFFLPDSTEVWLNAASTIRFPSHFNEKMRLVELDGEAYFNVYQNKRKPFVVKNGSFEVQALGTRFNICAYSEDKKFTAALEEGKIQVSGKTTNQSLILDPGELVRYAVEENQFTRSRVDIQDIIAWKDGRLIFNQTPFSDVALALGRWFNADIHLSDQSIANYRYTATFTNESLKQVMESLKLTAPINYSSEDRIAIKDNHFTKERVKIWKDPNAKIKNNN